MTNRFTSRKFLLTAYFSLAATVLTACKLLNGGEFVEITLAILAVHHGANVADGYFNPPTTTVDQVKP